MIDLEKEREAFEARQNSMCSNLARWKKDGDYISERTCSEWFAWQQRAELAQQEVEVTKRELEFATKTINNLLEKLEAKHKAYIFLDDCRKEWHRSFMRKCEENKELKAKLDKYESDDVVLLPRLPTMPMLIKGRHSVERLLNMPQLENLYKAMIESGEIK